MQSDREMIKQDLLKVLVELLANSKDSFSAYDLTSELREKLPKYEIVHKDVQYYLNSYALKNNFTIINGNNGYKVYSKPSSTATISTPAFSQKLTNLATTALNTGTKLASLARNSINPVVDKLKVRSGNRVTISNDLLKKYWGFVPSTFSIKNNGSKLVLSTTYTHDSMLRSTNSENRFRLKNPPKEVVVKLNGSQIEIG
jgi:hypothetical protein